MKPLRPVLRAHDLTEQQWRLLRVLMESGPAEVSKASEQAVLLGPSATRIIRELLSRALIGKRQDPNDARRYVIFLTPQGKAILQETFAEVLTVLQGIEAAFGVERLEKLVAELQDFREAIKTL
ncbi:hypothetical protein BH10PSE15_BH10PSE15_00680 [soil metagenome]